MNSSVVSASLETLNSFYKHSTRHPMALAALSAGIVFFSPRSGQLAAEPEAAKARIKIVLAGDSTVTDDAGWGKGFANCLTDKAECINLAKGGRSSKSFIAEGSWKKCLDLK